MTIKRTMPTARKKKSTSHSGKLDGRHLKELKKSGIKAKTAEAAGIYSESRSERIARLLNWKKPNSINFGSSLVFRYADQDGTLNGYTRIKPDKPRKDGDGKAIKYEAPKGQPARAYFPPGTISALLDAFKPLLITEGEKKALKADQEGFPTIGLSGVWGWQVKRKRDGEGKPRGERLLIDDLERLPWNGRKVYIVFDSDIAENQNAQHAERELAKSLRSKAAIVKIVRLPASPAKRGNASKVGLDDFLVQHSPTELAKLLEEAREPLPTQSGDDSRSSLADRLVGLVQNTTGVEFFESTDGLPFATVPIVGEGIYRTLKLGSDAFGHWVRRSAFHSGVASVPDASLNTAVGVFKSMAHYGASPRQPVFNRAGFEGDGSIWIDLGNEAGEAVHITANGWTVEPKARVKFVRNQGQLPIPKPVKGGSLSLLKNFCNVTGADWPLFAGFLLASIHPHGPYPALVLFGEQGTSKSTLARIARTLIDPHSSLLRAMPRNELDLMIAASKSWLLAFDNLSHIPSWLSDAFCRLATGGSFTVRQLYSDDEEVCLNAMRPVILNGIEEIATRSDLLDRSLILELPTIPPTQRRTELEFWNEFEQLRPPIFGALLDALAAALRRLPEVNLPAPPRLADFAKLVVAGEKELGLKNGEFLQAYEHNRSEANNVALESSPVGPLVINLALKRTWRGTATELLEQIQLKAPRPLPHNFPKNSRALSGILKRLAPNFRAKGVLLQFARKPGGARERTITIERSREICVPERPAASTRIAASRKKPGKPRGTQGTQRDAKSGLHACEAIGKRKGRKRK